jgi:hypothetical protein
VKFVLSLLCTFFITFTGATIVCGDSTLLLTGAWRLAFGGLEVVLSTQCAKPKKCAST